MLLSEGQMSDYKGAALMIDALPKAKTMLGDRGYDADWFRQALARRGITPCIPGRAGRTIPIRHGKTIYRAATASRSCSDASKTGGASTPATTDAPIPSCPLS